MRVFWYGFVEELLWFISGSTNAKVQGLKRFIGSSAFFNQTYPMFRVNVGIYNDMMYVLCSTYSKSTNHFVTIKTKTNFMLFLLEQPVLL